MKEITKKDLELIIQESFSEVKEMAYEPKGTQASRTDAHGKPIPQKFKAIVKPEGSHKLPDGWVLNPKQIEGEERVVMFLHGQELEDFINENGEFLDQLREKTGKEIEIIDKNKTKDHPRSLKTGTKYVPSGEKYSAKEKIVRGEEGLYKLVDKYFADDEMKQKLDELSIPLILSNDVKHLDRKVIRDNDRIEYSTHSFNSYTSSKQFLAFVKARIRGRKLPEEFKSYHLARQFNKIYRNWKETKKNDQKYFGKTPGYMLDKFGLDDTNLDVTVRTDLKILGYKENNSFVWNITFNTKFGRKLSENPTLANLDLDKEIIVTKSTDIDPQKEFNDQNTIFDDLSVKQSFIEGLSEMREKIMEMESIDTLQKANVKQYDITKPVNEGKLFQIVQSVMIDMKK